MANKYQLADSATEALKEKLIHTNHVHLFGETAWLPDIKSFLRAVKTGQPELELHETEPPKAASGGNG